LKYRAKNQEPRQGQACLPACLLLLLPGSFKPGPWTLAVSQGACAEPLMRTSSLHSCSAQQQSNAESENKRKSPPPVSKLLRSLQPY